MPKRQTPNLTVIGDEPRYPSEQPPSSLGAIGMSLWQDIVRAYEFGDRASYEILFQASAAADRAESCRVIIDRDGELLKVRGGAARDHPLLKHELAARAFVCRSLQRLGLDLEPVRGIGRPGGFA